MDMAALMYDRKHLIERMGKALDAQRTGHHQEQNRLQAEADRRAVEWTERHGETWKQTIRRMSAKLRKGEPITRDDLPTDGRGYHALFNDQARLDEFRPHSDVANLLEALKATSNDQLSAAQLTHMVGGSTLRAALRSASYYLGEG